MRKLLALPALLFALLGVVPAPSGSVSVLYAGSLVTPMEGSIATEFHRETGLTFAGEGRGSKVLAHLIAAKLRTPDIFISADPALVAALGARVASSVTFGHGALAIGWAPSSRRAKLFDAAAAGKVSLLAALRTPGLRIGRTDPRLDPKGARTIRAMRLLAGEAGERAILGADSNPAQVFPEQDLLVRLETGDADVAFLYTTEAQARHLRSIVLPGKASLTDEITFTLAIMRDAPNPAGARAFANFVLHGDGRRILTAAGVVYY